MVFEYLGLFLLPVTNMTDGEPSYHITGFIECLFYQATMFGNAQKNILSVLALGNHEPCGVLHICEQCISIKGILVANTLAIKYISNVRESKH